MKKLLLSLIASGALMSNAQVIPVGSSGNMFTLLNSNMHCLSVSDACSSVVFIHRSNPAVNPTDNIAHYRYAISTDKGNTFLQNQGKLNASADNTTKSSRYPQVVIDNAAGATNPADVWMQYVGSYHNNSDWEGANTGAAKMDNSAASFTDNYSMINNGEVGTISSLCKGANNTFWAIASSLTSANVQLGDLILLKGTKTGNNVSWASHVVFQPPFDLHKDGNPRYQGLNVDFDANGQNGWVSFLGDIRSDLDPNKDEVYDLVFYRTQDGGTSWTGPYSVNLNDFNLIQTVYPTPTTGTNIIHAVTAGFEADLAVDDDGQPHMFFGLGYGSSASEISAGNGYSIRASNLFDLTYDKNIDRFVLGFVAPIRQMRADSIGFTDGTSGVIPNTEDQRLQIAKTPSGDGLYYLWTDNIEQNIGGIDTVIENHTARYLYAMGAASNGGVSLPRIVSMEPAYSAVNDKAYLFTASPIVQRSATPGSVLPVVYGILNANDQKLESAGNFNYMQNIEIRDDSIKYLQQKDTLGFEVEETWPVAVAQDPTSPILNVYPNPAQSHFGIANIQGANNVVRVYNINGSVAMEQKVAASLYKTFDIKNLASGTYVVELVSDNKVLKTKLIKK